MEKKHKLSKNYKKFGGQRASFRDIGQKSRINEKILSLAKELELKTKRIIILHYFNR